MFLWWCLSLICLHPNLSVLQFFGNVTLAMYISQQHITNSYPSAIQLITILLPLTCPQHLNSSSKMISRLCMFRASIGMVCGAYTLFPSMQTHDFVPNRWVLHPWPHLTHFDIFRVVFIALYICVYGWCSCKVPQAFHLTCAPGVLRCCKSSEPNCLPWYRRPWSFFFSLQMFNDTIYH